MLMAMPLLNAVLAWLAILVLAVANGALREAVLVPLLGAAAGLTVSGLLLCALIAAVAYAFTWLHPNLAARQALLVGVLWLGLTLVFEFGLGRFVQHKSWGELLDAYRFKDGNLWPAVLLATLLAPYLAARWRARRRGSGSGTSP